MRKANRHEKDLMLKTIIAFLKLKLQEMEPENESNRKKILYNVMLQNTINVLLNHHTVNDLITPEIYENFE